MADRITWVSHWLYRRAENILAAMLGAMFVVFLLQIGFRYLLNLPIGWTNEASVVLWIWIVLFGAAFVLREHEEIRFDLFHSAASPRTRRMMSLAAAAGLLVLYGMSLPAVFDYVTFMRVESTAYLKIRFDWLFSIYVVFVAASIIRYGWLGWKALVREEPSGGAGQGSGT
jgi:TRAP-type C4-dicarboxylate transport system permease small subunit